MGMENDFSVLERLVIIETSFDILKAQHTAMLEKLDKLIRDQEKNKGFWAGVLAAGTAAGAALGSLISYIIHTKGS
jgi:hypothetical protein